MDMQAHVSPQAADVQTQQAGQAPLDGDNPFVDYDMLDNALQHMREHPLAYLGLALAAGYLASRMFGDTSSTH